MAVFLGNDQGALLKVAVQERNVEADLHSEVRALRSEIAELRSLLRQPRP